MTGQETAGLHRIGSRRYREVPRDEAAVELVAVKAPPLQVVCNCWVCQEQRAKRERRAAQTGGGEAEALSREDAA
jgi:hypothetical protein